jgi:putative aldouronate transport system permease protein
MVQNAHKIKNIKQVFAKSWPFHLILLPGMIILVLYNILPMFLGVIISLQNFVPALGIWKSEFVGLDNFRFMFMIPDTWLIIRNTLVIAVSKMVLTLGASILFAILLHESQLFRLKKTVQTIAYLPHFLSWVILASIFRNLLDSDGIVNQLLMLLGFLKEPIVFLGNNQTFQPVVILTDVWKEFGYGAIIFIAALSNVNPELYEAAVIDGASRLRRIWNITLPSILMTIVLVATLNLSNVLNAGFDQVFNLYSPIVYQTGDIIDTYVYRAGFISYQFSLATAVGIMKSAVSFIMIALSFWLANRYANYRIF